MPSHCSCTGQEALRLEERVGANCRAFQLTSASVQAGLGGLCWSTAPDWSPGACTAGVPVGLAPCASGGAVFSFNKTSRRVQSGHCAGMCAAKAGGPPASPAIVLDKCIATDATGWTAAGAALQMPLARWPRKTVEVRVECTSSLEYFTITNH